MWPWKRTASATSRKKLTAFLDEGSEIEGKYTFTGTVLLNGKFQGEIASPDTLIIGERGVVNATVRAGTLVVNGELVGNVHASDRVELSGKARVFGDLESPVVVLEEGVFFEGHCRMPRPAPEVRREVELSREAEPRREAEPSREASVVPLKRS